jgi:hypothetical protein
MSERRISQLYQLFIAAKQMPPPENHVMNQPFYCDYYYYYSGGRSWGRA